MANIDEGWYLIHSGIKHPRYLSSLPSPFRLNSLFFLHLIYIKITLVSYM